jgi:hypothetical protein
MEENLLSKDTPNTLKLADGKEYELPIMNLTTLANVEKTIGFGLAKLQSKIVDETASTLRLVIYALLKEKNSKLSLEEVGNLVTFETMKNVSTVLSKILAIAG